MHIFCNEAIIVIPIIMIQHQALALVLRVHATEHSLQLPSLRSCQTLFCSPQSKARYAQY